jgi:hypothetical protein
MFYYISKKQTLVTHSSNESEIYGVVLCMYNIEWIPRLLNFLHCIAFTPTVIYEDNMASIDMLTGKTRLSTKSKHINWRHQYALQATRELTAYLKWIEGENQTADILTKYVKPLP